MLNSRPPEDKRKRKKLNSDFPTFAEGLVVGLELGSRLAANQLVLAVVLLLAASAGHFPQHPTNGEGEASRRERHRGARSNRRPNNEGDKQTESVVRSK